MLVLAGFGSLFFLSAALAGSVDAVKHPDVALQEAFAVSLFLCKESA